MCKDNLCEVTVWFHIYPLSMCCFQFYLTSCFVHLLCKSMVWSYCFISDCGPCLFISELVTCWPTKKMYPMTILNLFYTLYKHLYSWLFTFHVAFHIQLFNAPLLLHLSKTYILVFYRHHSVFNSSRIDSLLLGLQSVLWYIRLIQTMPFYNNDFILQQYLSKSLLIAITLHKHTFSLHPLCAYFINIEPK